MSQMTVFNEDSALKHLVELTHQLAKADYSRAGELFKLTPKGQNSEAVKELAEAFGMMMVQLEAREYRLEQILDDLRQTNRRLEAALEEIKASDAAKQKVIDHLSHELKTPLAIISSVLHSLVTKFPENDHPKIAKTLDRSYDPIGPDLGKPLPAGLGVVPFEECQSNDKSCA